MENKTGIILNTLIEKLRKNSHFFGNIAYAENYGTNLAVADIAMENGGIMNVYRVIVIKHSKD